MSARQKEMGMNYLGSVSPRYGCCQRTPLIAIHYFSRFVCMGYGLCGSEFTSGSLLLECGSSSNLRSS